MQRSSILVLTHEHRRGQWKADPSQYQLIELTNERLFITAVEALLEDCDIRAIIFDSSITRARFLDFLTTIPLTFQGDVLLVEAGGGGYLSAAAHGAGRVLYHAALEDVAYYRSEFSPRVVPFAQPGLAMFAGASA